jgi:hypothetical protein
MHPFTDFDTAVRLALYEEFVRTASSPTAESIAAYLQVPAADVRAAMERLAAGKAIVLQPESREILMANPLCAVPTPFLVRTQGRSFFASCVWDGLGIMAMLRSDSVLETSCACCGEALAIGLRDGRIAPASGVIHFAVPAKRWWENIVFT